MVLSTALHTQLPGIQVHMSTYDPSMGSMCICMCVCVHMVYGCAFVCAWGRGEHVCVWCMGVHVLACRDLVGRIYCEQEISNTCKYTNHAMGVCDVCSNEI